MENKQIILPISIVSPTDIARLEREVANLDEYFRQTEIRTGEVPAVPRYSRLLDELIVANELNLLESGDRTKLSDILKQLDKKAPVLHISFSADPPGAYIQKIVGWLRDNIDGFILVRVGLQPNIGAGCMVRTANKAYDFSLRKYFDSKHDFFAKKLHEVLALEQEISTQTAVVEQPTAEQLASQNQQIDVETPA
jgi:hypothetical protein